MAEKVRKLIHFRMRIPKTIVREGGIRSFATSDLEANGFSLDSKSGVGCYFRSIAYTQRVLSDVTFDYLCDGKLCTFSGALSDKKFDEHYQTTGLFTVTLKAYPDKQFTVTFTVPEFLRTTVKSAFDRKSSGTGSKPLNKPLITVVSDNEAKEKVDEERELFKEEGTNTDRPEDNKSSDEH